MRRPVIVTLLVLCAVGPAVAAEAKDKPRNRRWELWKAPFYLVVGSVRDAVDAPVKLLTGTPGVRRVLHMPLVMINTVTSVTTWWLTDDGVDGGTEAYVALLDLKKKRRPRHGAKPLAAQDRRWWQNYAPNLRTLINIAANKHPKQRAE